MKRQAKNGKTTTSKQHKQIRQQCNDKNNNNKGKTETLKQTNKTIRQQNNNKNKNNNVNTHTQKNKTNTERQQHEHHNKQQKCEKKQTPQKITNTKHTNPKKT